MTKFNFNFDEWTILNELLVRPDKAYLLACLDASIEDAPEDERAEDWDKTLGPVLTDLRTKVVDMSEETLRDLFSILPVDPCLGISLYR